MDYTMYLMKALTNMHVGGGDDTFGVVDKLVQRDPVTHYPTIYSSSLKGALRENFKGKDFENHVFGFQDNISKNTIPGNYRFFPANLLALPARSDIAPFFLVTSPAILQEFINTISVFKIEEKTVTEIELLKNLSHLQPEKDKALVNNRFSGKIEDWATEENDTVPEESTLLGKYIALVSDEDFKKLSKNLPVIARNHLENGQSANLWYEEIVPRETLFYFVVGLGTQYKNDFECAITEKNVQIGANASIGYGFTQISKIGG